MDGSQVHGRARARTVASPHCFVDPFRVRVRRKASPWGAVLATRPRAPARWRERSARGTVAPSLKCYSGASTCDGSGTCGRAVRTACGAYACGSTTCRHDCERDTDCVDGAACSEGKCTAVGAGGSGASGAGGTSDGSAGTPEDPEPSSSGMGGDMGHHDAGAAGSPDASTGPGKESGGKAGRSSGCACSEAGGHVDRSPERWVALVLLFALLRRRRVSATS